ncbi:hypothetical protein TNCV_3012581 [Trichonephila clavipes]|nr:hypothetical protein TNCV_3012581 [Trichonephila clavipes]
MVKYYSRTYSLKNGGFPTAYQQAKMTLQYARPPSQGYHASTWGGRAPQFENHWSNPTPQSRVHFNHYVTFDDKLPTCATEVEEIVDL